jgi:quinolinate synthase
MVSTLEKTASSAVARRPEAKAVPPYQWSKALESEMAPLYARVRHVITPMEWPYYAPLI